MFRVVILSKDTSGIWNGGHSHANTKTFTVFDEALNEATRLVENGIHAEAAVVGLLATVSAKREAIIKRYDLEERS